MKKILIITHWFYPRQNPRAFRSFELYRELKKKNEVDVLIGDWKCYLKSSEDYHTLDSYGSNKVINKNAKLSNYSLVQLALKVLEYFIGERYLLTSGIFLYKSINFESYDAVISIGLPFYIHWVTSFKLRKYNGNIISISDWGDPFYGDSVKKIAPYFKRIQKKVCNTFNFVVTPTHTAVEYYSIYKKASENVKVIPQGFNFNDIELSEYKKNEIPHFAYAGIFYLDKRNPEEFLAFLSSLKRDFVFSIFTITHGPVYQDILMKYKDLLGDKLQIYDIVPRLDCIKILSTYDFLVNIDNLSTVQVPSKLIDYTLTKRPIISFKQDDIPKERFFKFLDGDYTDRLSISIDKYRIENVCDRFIDLLNGEKIDE